MMNTLKLALPLTALAFGAASAQSTWYTTGTGNKNLDSVTHWTDQSDGSAGTQPASIPYDPTVDTDTWVIRENNRLSAAPSNDIFTGAILQLLAAGSNDGEFQLWGENFTVQDVILDGGALNVGANGGANRTLTGNAVTLNSGIMGIERNNANWIGTFDFATYTGSGDILLQGRGNGSTNTNQRAHLRFGSGGDFSGFTGTFTIQAGMKVGFDSSIAVASFGMTIEDGGGTYQGQCNLLSDVSVTTLTAGPDHLAPGTYTLDTIANPTATDLTSVGGTDYSAYFLDSAGTITVTTSQSVTLPSVTQDPAESIDETIASIPGTVTDTGGETPTLTVYIGTTDGMDVPGAWDTPASFGPTFGSFFAELAGLTTNTTYFYRCRVTNSATTSDSEGWAAASGTFTTGTVPDTVTTAQNGAIDDSPTWDGSPPVPTSGTADTRTWLVADVLNEGAGSFAGQELLIDSGTLNVTAGTLTVRNVTLNSGGLIRQDNSSGTLIGDTLALNGGDIRPDRKGSLFLNFNSFTGSGTILLTGNNVNLNSFAQFQSSNADPMTGFTGELQVELQNGNMAFSIGFDVPTPTFSMRVGNADGSSTNTGRYYLLNHVSVTALRLVEDLPTIDVSLADGTYALDLVANSGAIDLSNVGGVDYSAFFRTGTGTITVDSGTTPIAGPVIVDVRHLGTTVELDLKGLDSVETYKVYRDTVLPLSGSKVQVGADVTGSTTATVTDSGPLPVPAAFYQAEQQ